MPFRRFFERRRRERAAADLYLTVVEQARHPDFYTGYGVPDTLEARFDMIVLHAWLLMRRLGASADEAAKPLSQAAFDLMFADMDRNLREMGVTDLRVGKRVHRMAEAFYGRTGAYDKALGEGEAALQAALARNLYQSETVSSAHLAAMAAYVKAQVAHLDALNEGPLLDGAVSFQPPQVTP
ncbi:MAG: ubiquinol-cytochrome C chaperone family protein [Rhodospirillaceae bacterium]|nr:ubiquinol-cytochrome C chaperone family protein [Rhodospirillales bacterium]